MSIYRDRMGELQTGIAESRMFRDAQEEDDPEHRQFQKQAKRQTKLWNAYNAAVDRLEQIDVELHRRNTTIAGMQRQQDRQERAVRTGAVMVGVVSGVVALTAWATPLVTTAVGVVALLAAAGAVVAGALVRGRVREGWSERVAVEQREVGELQREYRQLHPEIETEPQEAPVPHLQAI